MKLKIFCAILALLFAINILPVGYLNTSIPACAASDNTIRAVWAPTLYALDFPTSYSASETVLKNNIDNLLNNVQTLGYNTLFFQVRPTGDAFYNSSIFPWSKYLTGTQGQSPENNFDPLAYITEQAHNRGIALHAWLNPYRLTVSAADKDKLSEDSIPKKYPALVVEHTDGKLYLNPGEPESNQLIIDGAMEIVRNYNVDGIHLDDYFYPGKTFKDDAAFQKYGSGYKDIGDWRRDNITNLIRGLDAAIEAEKPDVIFSVSPGGIWANNTSMSKGSATNGNQTFFNNYADTRLWVKEGIVDWIMPQIYWNFGYDLADFETVARWWESVVDGTDVKLCIGQAVYKAAEETKSESVWYGDKGAEELRRQSDFAMSLKNSIGYAHYRFGSVLSNNLLIECAKGINAKHTHQTVPEPTVPDVTEPIEPEAPEESEETDPESPEISEPTTPDEPEVIPPESTEIEVPEAPDEPEDSEITEPEFDEEDYRLFSDLDMTPWAADSILALHKKGIIKGMNDGTFGCRRNVTRADFTIMLVRILGKDAKVLKNFEDVTPDKYYYHEIGVARVMGITTGRDGVIFDPTGNITREDMATLVYRLLEKENKLNNDEEIDIESKFSDSDKISGYAKEAVKVMCAMDLLSGYDTGDFQPKGIATRSETAVFLHRVSKLF